MKRQLLTFAAAAAVALCTIIACSKKDSNPEKLALNSTQMSGPDDPSSIAECYTNMINTLKNPPADYIPGDAENAFTACANSFINLGGGGGGSLKPPAPPFPADQIDPFFVDPPTRPDPYIDGEKLICDFFGKPYPLMVVSPLPPSYLPVKGKIKQYNSIINIVVSNNALLPTSRDKVNACINHVVNYGTQYFGLNRDEFFRYLTNVVYKYNTKLTIRSQFADMLEINNADFKNLFIERTNASYP